MPGLCSNRSTIGKKRFVENTLIFLICLALNTMKNIYSNFMINVGVGLCPTLAGNACDYQ